MAGRPLGSQNKDKPFREALRLELASLGEEDPKGLRGLAKNLLKLAASSEKDALQAIREVADRLDGKPAQEASIDVTTTHHVNRMTDDELEAIAAGGGNRTAASKESPRQLN